VKHDNFRPSVFLFNVGYVQSLVLCHPVFSTLVASLRSTLALDLAICQSFDHRLTRGSGIEKRSPRAFDAT
jgi:hypothetical protein